MPRTRKLTSLLLAGVLALPLMSAEAAFAGGKSGEHGGGRKSSSSESHESRGNNGRGAVASELKGLNAAHANEQAFLHASENSQVGRLAPLREAYLATESALGALEATPEEGACIDALSSEDIQSYRTTLLAFLTPPQDDLGDETQDPDAGIEGDPMASEPVEQALVERILITLNPEVLLPEDDLEALVRLVEAALSDLSERETILPYCDALSAQAEIEAETLPSDLSDDARAELHRLLVRD